MLHVIINIHETCTYVSDPQCVSTANHSAEWLTDNFGFFLSFASITDFYKLNQNFSGVNLEHLTGWNPSKSVAYMSCTVNDSISFFSRSAGGSSSPVSKSDSRAAAVASSHSAWKGRRHRPSVWLPVGVPSWEETYNGAALSCSACQRGNGFVMTDYDNMNALTWTVKYKLFTFSGWSTLQLLQTCVSEIFWRINLQQITSQTLLLVQLVLYLPFISALFDNARATVWPRAIVWTPLT